MAYLRCGSGGGGIQSDEFIFWYFQRGSGGYISAEENGNRTTAPYNLETTNIKMDSGSYAKAKTAGKYFISFLSANNTVFEIKDVNADEIIATWDNTLVIGIVAKID